jgi:hypothetical protein
LAVSRWPRLDWVVTTRPGRHTTPLEVDLPPAWMATTLPLIASMVCEKDSDNCAQVVPF